jgi:TfoX/Sxy family transcriptional regulator of competence genes
VAYDAELADRIREIVSTGRGVTEKRMFGGLAFLVDGHMAVAAIGAGGLMVRVQSDHTERLLQREHAAPMIMSGREIKGWLRVGANGVRTMRQLRSWVRHGVDYAKALPPK